MAGKKVFIVDDNHMLLEYLRRFLSKKGHDVTTADDGLSAVKMLLHQTPDILFLDYFIPNIKGDVLCQILRKMEHLNNSPIIMLSAAAAEMDFDEDNLAADAFIAKSPFDETALHVLEMVNDSENLLNQSRDQGIVGIKSVYARQMTVELLQHTRHLESILDRISEGIVELYRDEVVYANSATLALFDMPVNQVLARRFQDLFPHPVSDQVAAMLPPCEEDRCELGLEEPIWLGGKRILLKKLPMEGSDSIIFLVEDVTRLMQMTEELAAYRDQLEQIVEKRTTALKAANEKLRQAEKVEVLSNIAGGVAHDLNNILSGLVGYPELLLMDLPEDSTMKVPLETIKSTGEKAAAIVDDLLTLTRRGNPVRQVLSPNRIIEEFRDSPELAKMLRYHPKVSVKWILEENLLNISASPVHILKTIMNLVSNACEAMPEGGTVRARTRNHYLDRPKIGYERIPKGEYVHISVSDNGTGILPDDLDRIFEPFFTKKKMGRSGTGLGMSVVWGTIKDYGGYIDILSESGTGTTFDLYFPVCREPGPVEEETVVLKSYRGTERVLVIDDIKEQRDIASRMLHKLGYTAETVASGEAALSWLDTHSADILLLDMIMHPGMDGLETYRRIKRTHPDQKAVIASGFSETDRVKEAQELGCGPYLKKPYSIRSLAKTIREALDNR